MIEKSGMSLWNDNWQFALKDIGTSIEEVISLNQHWYNVELPHDWLILDTRDLYRDGEGWYRKTFTVSEKELGCSFEVVFDGIYMNSTVYVNGKKIGEWKYGYTSFSFEISDYLVEGENTILVQIRHESPNTRWYSGAGIYRNVWLVRQSKTHIIQNGVYISPHVENGSWDIQVETEYVGLVESIRYTVFDAEKNAVKSVVGNESVLIAFDSTRVWSLDDPYVYTLKTELIRNGEVIDYLNSSFGFRTIEFSPDEGFKLNGRVTKLKGVCMHHDLGALGSAFNVIALRRQLEIMKSMGVNAVRTSHNPPAREFVDLCDKMGILMMDEAFDMWELAKTDKDYSRFFSEWHEKDVASWVRRDRNHPCLVMWSIGNEIVDTHKSTRGLEIAKALKAAVLKSDPYGNAPVTMASNYMQWENAQKVADALKLAGYNYTERLYDDHHKKHPDWFIFGSETSSSVRSRGIYHFPIETPILIHDDLQCSDLGNSIPGWAGNSENALVMDRDRNYCGGQFIWTGFDYIGEPTPYNATKNSYFGAVDTAGFPKSAYYLYKSMWSEDKKPFVKLFPHWDWNEGQLIDVISFSNVPVVELFLNGNSLGKRQVDLTRDAVLHAHWKVRFEKGELLIKAYDASGNIVATDRKVTFGDASQLTLDYDRNELVADGRDLKFITITALDDRGNFVENANNRITVSVKGAARLVGLDNGDSADYDSYKGDNRRLFSGMLLAIIQTGFDSGDVAVEVSSKGIKSANARFIVSSSERPEGVSVCTENVYPPYIQPVIDEIPVRKIQLIADRLLLDENSPQATVEAKLFPGNATYSDIAWKCVSNDGNEVNNAVVSYNEGSTALVKALGDGEFRLRAYCKNGTRYEQVTSDIEMKVTGLGEAVRSPYKFNSASASHYRSETEGVPGVVIPRGGIMARERMVFSYPDVDFGKIGSDRLILEGGNPLPNPTPIEVWLGDPDSLHEGSEKIAVLDFAFNGMYDNYAPQEFKLDRRIAGTRNISFVVTRLVYGGFRFVDEKAFYRLNASDNSAIYGDAYNVVDDRVEDIGNNVTLEFDDMDFGERGAQKITLCGRTPNSRNPIQLRYRAGDGEQHTQMIEFSNCSSYTEQSFDIEKIYGKVKINFVFMPGSNFDFEWFIFS